jgi:hypothetical protein
VTSTEQLWARGLAVQDPTPLGWQPLDIVAVFSMGQDWIVTLQPVSNTTADIWPDGTTIVVNCYAANTNTALPLAQWPLEFAWAAVITDNTVYIKASSTATDTVEDGALIRIMVSFPNTPSSDDYCWAKGVVQRRD